jgi:ankyrin repeat protein
VLDVPIVEALMRQRADANLADISGETPLHIVARFTSAAALVIVEVLMKAGAQPNILSGESASPLDLATDLVRFTVLCMSLRHGGSVNHA